MLKNRIIASVLTALCLVSCDTAEPEDNNRMEIPEDLVFQPIWVTGLYEGGDRYLYPWRGEHVILCSYRKDLDKAVMQKWVGWCDDIYEFYVKCIGREPDGYRIDGLLPIIQYRGTGAAAVGWVGYTGIYMEVEYFDGAYKSAQEGSCYGLNAYEMGRNFWFLGSKLQWMNDDFSGEPWCTGFAVYFESAAMEANNIPNTNGDTRAHYTKYMNNPGARIDNTLLLNQGLNDDGSGATDLFAAFCLKLKDTFGDKWTYNVWKQVLARPDRRSDQDSIDNFVIASSIAAEYDLSDLFEYWRWTVSDNAKGIIKGYSYPVFDPSTL